MTHDRVQSDVLVLTHEFLAIMLGVRRASVSEILEPLQHRGLILTRRGKITVLDRTGLESAACECYRAGNEDFDRPFA
jgi:CRP-like cAMP-binding protein